MDGGDWRAAVLGVSRVGHDIETKPQPPPLLIHTFKFTQKYGDYISQTFKILIDVV